jgi:hypothetical protein
MLRMCKTAARYYRSPSKGDLAVVVLASAYRCERIRYLVQIIGLASVAFCLGT